MAITHIEVRRHPRWRAELNTPLATPHVPTGQGTRLLGIVALLIVATALGVLILTN
jgi:hypothetical protein